VAHNHPSGDPEPSRPDIETIKAIAEAGAVLKILVHDHMIVGRAEVRSLRAMGLL
jgi:DNA repair protein RadC